MSKQVLYNSWNLELEHYPGGNLVLSLGHLNKTWSLVCVYFRWHGCRRHCFFLLKGRNGPVSDAGFHVHSTIPICILLTSHSLYMFCVTAYLRPTNVPVAHDTKAPVFWLKRWFLSSLKVLSVGWIHTCGIERLVLCRLELYSMDSDPRPLMYNLTRVRCTWINQYLPVNMDSSQHNSGYRSRVVTQKDHVKFHSHGWREKKTGQLLGLEDGLAYTSFPVQQRWNLKCYCIDINSYKQHYVHSV